MYYTVYSYNVLYRQTPQRYIQRLPTTPFSLVLRKEYFDCPQRDSHAVHYIQKRGEERVYALVACSLATVTSCIDASVRIETKSPKVRGPLLIFSISLGFLIKEQAPDPFPKKFEFGSSSGSRVKNATFCKDELNLIFVY
jgi:hypothetical protein